MKKSDLKYGNVVETREGIKYLYHWKTSDKFLNLDYDGFLWIRNFDENLKCFDDLNELYDLNELDIMKVYKDYTCKELLWERKDPKITEDEKIILRNIPKQYEWIARDACDSLCVYTKRPIKQKLVWSTDGWMSPMALFHNLFRFIKWEDDEPYSIEELLKGEEK